MVINPVSLRNGTRGRNLTGAGRGIVKSPKVGLPGCLGEVVTRGSVVGGGSIFLRASAVINQTSVLFIMPVA
jgi:hypothetical protein